MEDKLLLLLAVSGLGPVTAEQLLRFFVEQEQLDYINLQLALAELTESGLLLKKAHPLGMLYRPSSSGLETLGMFQKRIPPSRIHAVEEALSAWRSRFTRERQVIAQTSALPDGEYEIRLKILEEEISLLELMIRVPSADQAERFCGAWSEEADALYAAILNTLNRDRAPDPDSQPPPVTPPGP